MNAPKRPTIGLALSGSGNRTAYYIGFLEVLSESGIHLDYISASSGGSLVAAAYACGKLQEFKEIVSGLQKNSFKQFIVKGNGKGGLYSLDMVEDELRRITGGLTFEELTTKISFDAVDIENGEKIILCMGDIARAARISCTLPGIFEPVQWGNRTLVDGGLLTTVPLQGLRNFDPDITMAINMRGVKFIFSPSQITMRRVLNIFKRILFVDEIGSALHKLFDDETDDEFIMENPGIFTVLGKSLDLAIAESKKAKIEDLTCDLLISPDIPTLSRTDFMQFSPYYEWGREGAIQFIPQIQQMIAEKEKIITSAN
jgi:predicted acylesterase/phospholipase RssA